MNATMRDMNPLSISFIRTAVAAEYVRDGGMETREWCMIRVNIEFWIAKVTRLERIVSLLGQYTNDK